MKAVRSVTMPQIGNGINVTREVTLARADVQRGAAA
jgi:hypothetical protein